MRPRQNRDLPAVVAALRCVHRSDRYPIWWPADPAAWLSPEGNAGAWVAEVGAAIVGHVGVVVGVKDDVVSGVLGTPSGRLASVTRLFVIGPVRGQGMGVGLLSAASAHARALDVALTLDVVEDGGGAPAFYERLGWRLVVRREADWVGPGGTRLPVRVYVSPLDHAAMVERRVTQCSPPAVP